MLYIVDCQYSVPILTYWPSENGTDSFSHKIPFANLFKQYGRILKSSVFFKGKQYKK